MKNSAIYRGGQVRSVSIIDISKKKLITLFIHSTNI